MFKSKEKKLKEAEAAEAAKAEAEFQAKYTAKQEKKKIEKQVAEIDKTIESMMAKAANAKVKGYADIYKQCVLMIKVARARKRQAESFLFQMEAMQEMQSLAKGSSELLSSMGKVMSSLGKLSVDKTVMMGTQRDFMAAQRELEKQTMSIEGFLSSMEIDLPEDDSSIGTEMFADSTIDAEIDSYIMKNSMGSGSGANGAGSSPAADLEELKGLLNS